jgi:hypothetical protein
MIVRRPASWQEDKSAFGLGQFDDIESDTVLGCGIVGAFVGITLIDPGKFDSAVGNGLH